MYSVHVPDSQCRKLDAKTHKAVFVGYPPGVKGYKVYDLDKEFVVSRDVRFFEKSLIILTRSLNQMMLIKQI